jgi:hypothetical protein
MISSGKRRELVDSVRLHVGQERRLFAGLVLGALGYPVWVAGTGVAVEQFLGVTVGPVSVEPWSGSAGLLVLAYLLLWVIGPSVIAVLFVVRELTNIRGNIEKHYRFDNPGALLAVPAIAFGVVLLVAVLTGFGFWGRVAVGGASVVVLVRTVAYGYRVYALSAPRLLQALLFVAAMVTTLAMASRAAGLAGQEGSLTAAAGRYGVQWVTAGTVAVGVTSVELLPLAGVLAPAALALTYVGCQLVAGQVVRIRQPEIPRSAVRAGQRYPATVQPAGRRAAGKPTAKATEETTGNGDGGADGDAATDAQAVESEPPGEEPFGDTRVYSPPDDGGSDGSGDSVKNELCPVCGTTYEADTDRTHCPNCNAVIRG